MYEINLFFYEFLINDNFVAMRENLLLSKREFENVNFVEWDIFREFVTTDPWNWNAPTEIFCSFEGLGSIKSGLNWT